MRTNRNQWLIDCQVYASEPSMKGFTGRVVMVHEECLQKMFKHINRKYFNNRLDPHIRISFKKMRYLGLTKNIWFKRPATAKERRENNLNKTAIACYYIPRIWISDKLKFSYRLCYCTLLHEMVHAENMKVKCGMNWGWFNKRMLELAKKGALNDAW